MHPNSYNLMSDFATKYVKDGDTVIDIGSYDVNGSYKDLFAGQVYVGMDIEAGPNVDIIGWGSVRGEYDVVISGQTLEHVKQPWEIVKRMADIVKPGGLLCIIAPNDIAFHEYPIDCYRYWPDGFRGLLEYANLEIIDCFAHKADTVGIARKK